MSSSIGSSRGSMWRERRQKWQEDKEHPRERKGPDWEKGRIRPTERFWVSRRIGSMMIETKNKSDCADW